MRERKAKRRKEGKKGSFWFKKEKERKKEEKCTPQKDKKKVMKGFFKRKRKKKRIFLKILSSPRRGRLYPFVDYPGKSWQSSYFSGLGFYYFFYKKCSIRQLFGILLLPEKGSFSFIIFYIHTKTVCSFFSKGGRAVFWLKMRIQNSVLDSGKARLPECLSYYFP